VVRDYLSGQTGKEKEAKKIVGDIPGKYWQRR